MQFWDSSTDSFTTMWVSDRQQDISQMFGGKNKHLGLPTSRLELKKFLGWRWNAFKSQKEKSSNLKSFHNRLLHNSRGFLSLAAMLAQLILLRLLNLMIENVIVFVADLIYCIFI